MAQKCRISPMTITNLRSRRISTMRTSAKAFASLSVSDILPVSKSWNVFKKKHINGANDLAATTFQKFLALEPKVTRAFYFDVDSETDVAYVAHVQALAKMMDLVFSSLFDLNEHLLIDLGRRHAKYSGFHAGFLASFSFSLAYALQRHMGNSWNPRLKMRWERVVSVMVSKISAGAEAAPVPRALAKNFAEVLDIEDINPVIESWAVVQQKVNYCEHFGELVFRKLFELAPSASRLFPFGKFEGESLFQSRIFKAHSLKVISTFDMVISSLLDIEKAPLVQLGARHACFGGVQVEHFATLGIAVVATLETVLRDDWNEKLMGHWINVISFISCSMIEGMILHRFL